MVNVRPLAYKKHPYRWATIGKELSHIENAKIEDVKDFFKKHYNPQSAILVVAGNVETEEIKRLAEHWFEPIPKGVEYKRNLPVEPKQLEERRESFTQMFLQIVYTWPSICHQERKRDIISLI